MKQRVVIIGGGVAGLATAIALQDLPVTVRIFERAPSTNAPGMGFILMPNGLAALDKLGLGAQARGLGKIARRATVKDPSGTVMIDKTIPEHLCLRRGNLINLLQGAIPENSITCGLSFCGFTAPDENGNRRAKFDDGSEVEADLFIAADGRNSRIRSQLFPEPPPPRVRIKEMLSMIRSPKLAAMLDGRLLKYQDGNQGLAVGMAGVGDEYVIWYVQYYCKKQDLIEHSGPAKRAFAMDCVGDWPDPVPELISLTNFEESHIWRTTDMDVLPTFHMGNVALIGDAAHVVLTLTGQGANAALEDAVALTANLRRFGFGQLELALTNFYWERKPCVEEYLRVGREKAAALYTGPTATVPPPAWPAGKQPASRDYVR